MALIGAHALFAENKNSNSGNRNQPEREFQLMTEDSDVFLCRSNNDLNLDVDAFKSSEVISGGHSSVCSVSTASGSIKAKAARVETLDSTDSTSETTNVKIFAKLQSDIVLNSDEQVILQCPTGSDENRILVLV